MDFVKRKASSMYYSLRGFLFLLFNCNEKRHVQRLLSSGVPADGPDSQCQSLLMHYIYHENVDLVRFLIEKGADVNMKFQTADDDHYMTTTTRCTWQPRRKSPALAWSSCSYPKAPTLVRKASLESPRYTWRAPFTTKPS